MNAAKQAAVVRRGAGFFELEARGLLEVRGSDRVRWLDGMVSNDVSGLLAGPERSGCYAALLTRQGRVVADLHVLLRPDALWLETAGEAVGPVAEQLGRYIVADDVEIADRSAEFARFGLEGPSVPAIWERAIGAPLELAPDACLDVRIAGVPLVAAAFGWSGEPAVQLFVPARSAKTVALALAEAGALSGADAFGPEALEILRIEAGVPCVGSELDEDVLPAEARLERAVSTTKGCYTGQEVVARLASRSGVKHLLVGLAIEGDAPPEVGAAVKAGSQRVGEVTSACRSVQAGAIALAFVRRPHDAEGTELSAGDHRARVVALPFVTPRTPPASRSLRGASGGTPSGEPA